MKDQIVNKFNAATTTVKTTWQGLTKKQKIIVGAVGGLIVISALSGGASAGGEMRCFAKGDIYNFEFDGDETFRFGVENSVAADIPADQWKYDAEKNTIVYKASPLHTMIADFDKRKMQVAMSGIIVSETKSCR